MSKLRFVLLEHDDDARPWWQVMDEHGLLCLRHRTAYEGDTSPDPELPELHDVEEAFDDHERQITGCKFGRSFSWDGDPS